METIKRNIAYKLRIGSLFHGKSVIESERFRFLEYNSRKIIRVNIIANIVEKYISDDRRYLAYNIDDASGQIRMKVFGEEEIRKFEQFSQGDTIMIIGNLKSYRNELYIMPEIIKKLDPSYLLVRKLEIENNIEVKDNNEIRAVRDQIIDIIKNAENQGGVDTEKIVMDMNADPGLINAEIRKILEEGLAYEPRPGRIRYLG
ncbi:OB-fold nucleic acid binding domain-containing protein [Candidatus Pacearchaeota archaeon]|nr:OB-fold nucleic acid binding domain-containing protein [Candidatus Pacearchaeota archaeon]